MAETDWSLPYAATITPAGLKADLDVLASDAYEGRKTGEKGQKMAADYIAKGFAADGLAGPVPNSDSPYFQQFTLNRVAPGASMKIGSRTFFVNKDYYLLLRDAATLATELHPTFIGMASARRAMPISTLSPLQRARTYWCYSANR